ncbi:d-isomer specific 2-hydroxyacid dehydrogenases signature 3 [Lucifera butyrica]|uniref:D-isomer specific 2-hydroxyacid dehydrogenases signature 3 n=1 Tax=Lucifera butyrica TaxID=1351585 RepID=A0A498RD47_9FIRM|nr:phosphoglycerate dehydrogenase [Lucifera butyrica]VBB07108.1 d-isomer specific 2-hydroxyacid dehydrogenases signature 3 [Lucifera butyrica]
MTKRILITALSFRRSKKALAMLDKLGYEVMLYPNTNPVKEVELLSCIKGVSALIIGNDQVTEQVIAAGMPDLKVITKCGAGYNTVDVTAAKRFHVPVTYTPGANTHSVADLTIGLILALVRNIAQLDQAMHAGKWDQRVGQELSGKTLGIIGTGHIGGQVIKRASGFDMKIAAHSSSIRQDLVEKYGVVYWPLSEVITKADIVSLHVPATAETRHMINMAVLQKMKRTACLINTARGDLVNEEDLCAALEQKMIAGAALDVFSIEPLPESKLCKLDNVILTPHVGATTMEAAERVSIMAAEDVISVLTGKAPRYLVW